MRENLIKYRGKRSQAEMAERYGVTQQTWSCWEAGTATPRWPIMTRIAQDAGQTVDSLFLQILTSDIYKND